MLKQISLVVTTAYLIVAQPACRRKPNAASSSGKTTVESVEAALAKKWNEHASLSADLEVVTERNSPEGKSRGMVISKYEYLRRGGKTFIRQEGRSSRVEEPAGESIRKTEGMMLLIADGEILYHLTDIWGEPTILKRNQDTTQEILGGTALFQTLHADYDLVLLPDQVLDGQEMYVIEGLPKPSKEVHRMVYYFDKKTGVALKMVNFAGDGSFETTLKVTNIRINPVIPPERFIFKAPPGVRIIDMRESPEEQRVPKYTPDVALPTTGSKPKVEDKP